MHIYIYSAHLILIKKELGKVIWNTYFGLFTILLCFKGEYDNKFFEYVLTLDIGSMDQYSKQDESGSVVYRTS